MDISNYIYLGLIVSVVVTTVFTRWKNSKKHERLVADVSNKYPHIPLEEMIFSFEGETVFLVDNNMFSLIKYVDGDIDEDRYDISELVRVEILVDRLRASELLNDFNTDSIRHLWRRFTSELIEDDSCCLVAEFVVENQPPLGLNRFELLYTELVALKSTSIDQAIQNLQKMRRLLRL